MTGAALGGAWRRKVIYNDDMLSSCGDITGTAHRKQTLSIGFEGVKEDQVNVLLVEDQQRLADALAAILAEAGYHVDTVHDGQSGLDYALSAGDTGCDYDAIVLDVMLPRMDGITVARELRSAGSAVPIIMLTARNTLRDKVTGLDSGADDYLTKPFQPEELLARLRAMTRRSGPVHVDIITLGCLTLDLKSGFLSNHTTDKDLKVHLSQREFELCRMLMANPSQVMTKAHLLSRIWGMDSDADENSVEAYVSFLRKKLAYLEADLRVTTIRGMGYRLEMPTALGDAPAERDTYAD